MLGRDEEPSEESTPPKPPPSLKRRIAQVVVSLLLGSVVAAAGYYFFGNYAWFAAIPIMVVLGWPSAAIAEPRLESKSSLPNNGPVLW